MFGPSQNSSLFGKPAGSSLFGGTSTTANSGSTFGQTNTGSSLFGKPAGSGGSVSSLFYFIKFWCYSSLDLVVRINQRLVLAARLVVQLNRPVAVFLETHKHRER